MQASVRGSDFVFDSVQLLYCKCRKINFKRGGSYIDSPDWIKKAVINEKNEVDKYFKYVLTVALNYRKVKWNWDRVSNIKTFINNYNWKVINHLTKIDHWKTFAKIIQQLLLIFCILKKKKYVQPIFLNKTQPVKKIILLMIPNEEE